MELHHSAQIAIGSCETFIYRGQDGVYRMEVIGQGGAKRCLCVLSLLHGGYAIKDYNDSNKCLAANLTCQTPGGAGYGC